MKRLINVLILTVFFLSLSNASAQEVTQQTKTQYQIELTKLLSNLNKVTGVPAFSVAVIHQGKLVASVATGYANVDGNKLATDQSIFRLASVSKIIGATMLAELVTSGKLNPDQAIGDIFPELDKKYHRITVRHLVSHTSGIPHYQMKDYDIYDKHYDSALAALSTLKSRSLLTPPGNNYRYSTHGYTLAGAIHEKVSGLPLAHSIPEFIKQFTGKSTPIIENIKALSPKAAKLYKLSGSQTTIEPFGEKSYSVFGAGLSATANDLAHFGYEVLSKAKNNNRYQRLLFTPTTTNSGRQVGNIKYQVGFGWRISKDLHDREVYHHAGATPGARSILMLYPQQELSISILSNASWISGIDKLAFALASLYIDKAVHKPIIDKEKYHASFDGHQASGQISCRHQTCYLASERTGYSKWLNKYNSTGELITDWPIFAYATNKGDRLLMVTKVGITSLTRMGNGYQANVGKNKRYNIKLNLEK